MADEHAIILRAEAKARGLKRYFTGKKCSRGHISERKVSGRCCVVCSGENYLKFRLANPDKVRTYTRASMKKLREREPEQSRNNQRQYYWKNPDHARGLARKYYEKDVHAKRASKKLERAANPERQKAAAQRHYQNNKEQYLAWGRNRKARKRKAAGEHTATDLAEILKSQKFICIYCPADLRKVKRHVDHIQPLSCGGSNDKTNIQYLCAPCNLSKGAKDPVEFARELGRLL